MCSLYLSLSAILNGLSGKLILDAILSLTPFLPL